MKMKKADTNYFKDNNKNDIILAFNKEDFYFYNNNTSDCKTIQPYDKKWELSCSLSNFTDNSYNCMVKELCINKDLYNNINNVQNNLNGSNEKYENVKDIYNKELLHKYNLIISIIFLFFFIIYLYR
jgi:hypothetical protein